MELVPRAEHISSPVEDLEIARRVAAQLREGVERFHLQVGNSLRCTAWLKDIQRSESSYRSVPWCTLSSYSLGSFEQQALPKIVIAVFGATGAGKSSLLNAILGGKSCASSSIYVRNSCPEDNIVPTGGMGAGA